MSLLRSSVLVVVSILAVLVAACSGLSAPANSAQEERVESFRLNEVRLLDGPFREAMERNIEYLLAMDPDRLLAPYLREAGLEPGAEPYGNWESTGLDGHIGGHYLSALALAYASTGDDAMRERLQHMIDELGRAQEANGNGYVGGVPGSAEVWAEIARGDIRADLFSLNARWVPWYNLHKVFAGLRDAHVHAGIPEARQMLVDLTDWLAVLVADLSDDDMQLMLRAEHGGMNEVLADVAIMTGDASYLELADRFSHRLILDPLMQGEDQLTGLHANTQIPKVVGYKQVADASRRLGVTGYDDWHDASEYFWNAVVNTRTVAIGGNSTSEHFHPTDDFSSMIAEVEGPETCNTYNMLRLTKQLFETNPQASYLDYYERALYNHILSSQHPDHGGLVYFTSMRPSHYRVYSQPELAMWCCVGSGIENHVRYGEMIYSRRGNDVYVNLFISSTLDWEEGGIRLRQETRFPDEEQVAITIESAGSFALNIRQPAWVSNGGMEIAVNGERTAVNVTPDGFARIERAWEPGDRVTVNLPMHTRLEQMPDESPYFAVLHGPIVLAARTNPFPAENLLFKADDSRMGHVAAGPICPSTEAPLFIGDGDEFIAGIQPVAGAPLTFTAPGNLRGTDEELLLIPFFRLHDSRYVVYWPHATEEQYAQRLDIVAQQEEARRALDAITVDAVAPGQQQPEVERGFEGSNTDSGYFRGRHWRHASGWFSYRLSDPNAEAEVLRVTYSGADVGRTFDITMNGVLVASVELEGSSDTFYDVAYPIPAEARERAEDGVLVTRFEAHPGSMAGGVFDVRLLRSRTE